MPANNAIIPQSVREAATEAAFRAIAGQGADPFHSPETWAFAETIADAVRAATQNTDSVPAGMVLVPVEPTREMRDAALAELSGPTDFDPKVAAWDAVRAYRAMIAAAATGSSDSYTPAGQLPSEMPEAARTAIENYTGYPQGLWDDLRAALTQGGSHGTE